MTDDLPARTINPELIVHRPTIDPGIPYPNEAAPTVGIRRPPSNTDWPGRDTAVQTWLTAYRSAHTQTAYANDIRRWFDWLDLYGVNLTDARRGDVDAYRSEMEDDDPPPAIATIRRRIATVSSFYIYWVHEGILNYNPAAHVRRPKASKEPGSIALTAGQVRQLLLYTDSLPDARPGVVVQLLLETGMRVSELCAATVADLSVSSGHRTLTIVRKGGVIGTTALLPATAHQIEVYLNGRTAGPLVATSGAKRGGVPGPLDRAYVRDLVRRLAVEAGLPSEVCEHMHPHVLRHTAATILDEDGVPMQLIQRQLGHADIRQTEMYASHRQALEASPVYVLGRIFAR